MYAASIALILLFVWLLWRSVNRFLYRDFFSPLNLLFYCWVAPLILCTTNASGLQGSFSPLSVTLLSATTVVLVVTSLLPAMFAGRAAMGLIDMPLPDLRRVRMLGIVAFFAFTLSALYLAEFRGRDLPLLAYLLGGASDSNLHTFGKDSRLQIVSFGIYSVAVVACYLGLHEPRTVRRFVYIAMASGVVLLGFFKASKSDVYIPIISYAGIIYYHYRLTGMRIPRVLLFGVFVISIVVVAVTAFRVQGIGAIGGYAALIDFRFQEQLGPLVGEFAAIVYGYTALGFENFNNYVVSHPVEFRLGTSLFRPVLSAFMLGSIAESRGVPVSEWNVVSDAANTGTFLTPLYIEGGALFCLLGALVYGSLVNFSYFLFRSARSARLCIVYVMFLFPWTWLFFTNAFSVLSVFVNVFYAALIGWLFLRFPKSQSREPAVSAVQ